MHWYLFHYTPDTPHNDDTDIAKLVSTLHQHLSQVATCWFQIGILLEIDLSTLEQMPGNDDKDHLQNLIQEWIDNYHKSCNLQRIVGVTRHRAGGNNARLADSLPTKLAEEIEWLEKAVPWITAIALLYVYKHNIIIHCWMLFHPL